ncbi:unnamed protein product [Nesidiocoris tenuis]|uniref:EGF-like domain-containing protein n=1 Tax=Nesidiocoris tenuis TaxID=355587 RepID=A0A6H5G6Q3_9HEMI|nr:unnamed protein product [Nesidiocoris tenuis]
MKAYHKFSLELEFQTFNLDGILFYAQQHQDGTGDFIALAIINGGMEDAPTFSGAIQKFIINGDRMFLASLIKTSLYEGEPCVPGACAANQTCVPALKEFKCICGLGTSCSNGDF